MTISDEVRMLRARGHLALEQLNDLCRLTQHVGGMETDAAAERAAELHRLEAEPRRTEAEARAWLDAHAPESGL